jgi:hypothetical protein
MVSKRRIVLSVFVAIFAFSAVAVANASATEFIFSKTGSLKGSALTTQKFTTGGTSWECNKEKITGTVNVLKTATQKITVQYEECFFEGIILFEASPAEYELNTNGTYKLLKTLTMKGGEACTISFPAQTLSKLTYANKPAGKIEITSATSKITSVGTGSLCPYGEEKETTSTGKSLLELTGGTAEVK